MRSAGTSVGVWPAMAKPHCCRIARNSGRGSWVRKPGMVSSLSSVPPVWPSERPEIMGSQSVKHSPSAAGAPAAATMGAISSEVLSPTPPVECLSTAKEWSDEVSSVSPEKRMAWVSAASSCGLSPRRKIAISSAAVWLSVGASAGGLGGRFPLDQRADEELDLGVGEDEAVALVLDHVDRVNGHEFDSMRRSATRV